MLLALILAATSTSIVLAGGTNERKKFFSLNLYSHNDQIEFGNSLSRNINTTQIAKRSAGGEFVYNDTAYPFMALIYKKYTFMAFGTDLVFCSGVILNMRHILTDAHCLCGDWDPSKVCSLLSIDNYYVRVGQGVHLENVNKNWPWKVSDIFLHPHFINPKERRNEYNIAIIRLGNIVNIYAPDKKTRIINLPQPASWQDPKQRFDDSCVMIGFRKTTNSDGKKALRIKTMKAVLSCGCYRHFNYSEDTTICIAAREIHKNDEHGNELASVLVCDNVVVGLFSNALIHKVFCDRILFLDKIYTRVDKHIDWIKEKSTNYSRII